MALPLLPSASRGLVRLSCFSTVNIVSKVFSRPASHPRNLVDKFFSSRAHLSQWTKHSLPTQAKAITRKSGTESFQLDDKRKVEVTRQEESRKIAYLSLGSNLGDRVSMIERACDMVEARGIRILRTSNLWETEPMYVLDQDRFLNAVVEVETVLSPMALLDTLQSIENDMGRKRIIDKGPRNIDLDILLYATQKVDAKENSKVFLDVENERLRIPHPLMFEREFVLNPLEEIIPYATGVNPQAPWTSVRDYLIKLRHSLHRAAILSQEVPERGVDRMPKDVHSTQIAKQPSMYRVFPFALSLPPLRPQDPTRQTQVMAIINTTPDSFSGPRDISSLEVTISEITLAVQDPRCTIIDIGGASSRPGATPVSTSDEIARTVPLINEVNRLFPSETRKFAISIDTPNAVVAAAAIKAGADIVNSISSFGVDDQDLFRVVAQSNKTIVIMHNRGTPETMISTHHTEYSDSLVKTIALELESKVRQAESNGIRRWRIILDPGIGFAKTLEQNVTILMADRFAMGENLDKYPWLVGSSRKGFIGQITGVQQPNKRLMGSAVAVAASISKGADIVRVHDVKEIGEVVRMADALWRRDITAVEF